MQGLILEQKIHSHPHYFLILVHSKSIGNSVHVVSINLKFYNFSKKLPHDTESVSLLTLSHYLTTYIYQGLKHGKI